MKYYKQIKYGKITSYISSSILVTTNDMMEISEEEYTEAINALTAEYEKSQEFLTDETDNRIAELEKENAELKNELGEVRKQIRQYTA